MSTKKYPCRCSKCGARRSLAQRPDQYFRPPACDCGSRMWYLDAYRLRVEMDSKLKCNCSSYHFPHRHKSKMCFDNQNVEINNAERYSK
jgi:hypothetical protein